MYITRLLIDTDKEWNISHFTVHETWYKALTPLPRWIFHLINPAYVYSLKEHDINLFQ